MEDNRSSERSEEELRCIIREEICRSREIEDEYLYERIQAMICYETSTLASSIKVDSGISSSLPSSTSPSAN